MEQHPPPSSARAVFDRALEIESPAQRQAYLAEACGGNDALRQEVDTLLHAHEEAGSFLESALPDLGLAATLDQPRGGLREVPGSAIGPYKLLQQLGEGGMGVVFLAEQQRPVRRQVALKVIKAGMDTRQVVARFEAERQALALMDHPNIARVLDAGATDSGRPYFVMELVKGVPFTRYCDEHRLTPRQRLELFIQVCYAVQHAHTKGIIHRDLKPTNVLVALYDGKPVPKVIDFGVAKATGGRLTDRTLFTGLGAVVGTPEYMSPEQAELNQLDVDTRSDVYSLGVMLYELLTGSTPVERARFKAAAVLEMLRVVREEEPPRPSTRLSTTDQLPSIAASRGVEPRKLSGLVRGELDWIVMKCLEKDRGRRYETANGLARDVERYLTDEAVHACPPSAGYRFGKFARRNKRPLAGAGLLGLALVLGTVASTWQALRARRAEGLVQTRLRAETAARERAVTEAAKASVISEFLREMLASANPDEVKGAAYSVRELLDDFSARLGNQLDREPEVEAEIRATMGRAYRRLGVHDQADLQLETALAVRRRIFGPEHEKVAESLIDYAWSLQTQKRAEEAEKSVREALRIYRLRRTPGEPFVKALWILQHVLISQGRYAEAEDVTQEALAFARGSPGAEFADLANILHRHAGVLIQQHRYPQAEEWAQKGVDMHRRLHGDKHPETGWGLHTFGRALEAQQKLAEAESAYREAHTIFRQRFTDEHATTVMALTKYKQVLQAQGKTAELETLVPRAVPRPTVGYTSRGGMLRDADAAGRGGHYRRAAELYTEALRREPAADALQWMKCASVLAHLSEGEAYHRHCQATLNRFAGTLHGQEAERAAKGCALWPSLPVDPAALLVLADRRLQAVPNDAWGLQTKGMVLYRAGRWTDAIEWLSRAADHEFFRAAGRGRAGSGTTRLYLAMAYARAGQQDKAADMLAKGLLLADAGADGLRSMDWQDSLITQLARWEAERIVNGRSTGRIVPVELTDAASVAARGQIHARFGRFPEALAHLVQAAELNPDSPVYASDAAHLLAYLGDEAGYQKARGRILERFGQSDDLFVQECVSRVCLLLRGQGTDWEAPMRLADGGVARKPVPEGMHLSKAIADYRAGDFTEAARRLERTRGDLPHVSAPSAAAFYLAMAYHRLDRAADADTAYLEGVSRMEELPAAGEADLGETFREWLICHVVRREAEGTLGRRPTTRPTSGPAPASRPFLGRPLSVPGTIQAEDFDLGADGAAFHDRNAYLAGMDGGRYRIGPVNISACLGDGGGHCVGAIWAGEWLGYTVDVAEAGLYDVDLRIAAPAGGGKLHLESGGKDLTGPVEVPRTGGFDTWKTVTSKPVYLGKGRQVLRLVFDSVPPESGHVGNLNWVRFTKSGTREQGAKTKPTSQESE